jgi:hypothetical protein
MSLFGNSFCLYINSEAAARCIHTLCSTVAQNSNVSSLQQVTTQQTTAAAATISPLFQTSSCFVDHDNKQTFTPSLFINKLTDDVNTPWKKDGNKE